MSGTITDILIRLQNRTNERRVEMERLVIKDGKGNLYFYDTERGVKLESYEVQPLQRREVLERLYEYEDTGLTPERIRKLAERDTAKEAIITGHNQAIGCKVGECPKCSTMARDYMNFCSECGQRLKWEE